MPLVGTRLLHQAQRMIHISRPVLWINAVGPAVIGLWLTGSLWELSALPVLLWLTLPFNLLIYGVNDVFDQDTDALNARKGTLEGARIAASEVRTILLWVAGTSVPFVVWFAATLPVAALAWIAAYIIVFVFYSAPPLRFKAHPFADSLSNSAYAFPLVFVPLALESTPVWPAALGLMAWSVAKHAYDAVQDIDEDSAVGITTTAVLLGASGTALWSGAWWIIATAFFAVVSWPVAAVNAAIAGFLVVALLLHPDPAAGHRLYKYSIAFPYVAGTVAGILLVISLTIGRQP